jgi:hypothetical protein
MQTNPTEMSFTVEVVPGKSLSLPPDVIESVGPGQWLVTIRPVGAGKRESPIRGHSAFLASYAPEDEGLYDDCAAR